MKTKFLLLGMTLFLLAFNSCNKDDIGNSSELNADEANVNAKIDVAADDVSGIVDDQLQLTLDSSTGKSGLGVADLPSCAVVTRVPAVGTPLTVGQVVTKTINFGTAGCEMPNGNILKGKIIITFTYQSPNTASHTATCTFENFYHNNVKINGTKTFTRTMSAAPSHPIITMTMNITATISDNVYTRTGTRTRETIEGYGDAEPNNNVYRIEGNWTTTLPNGRTQVSEITTPLIKKANCRWIISGVIEITRNERVAILNFGNTDDECNDDATVTINGVEYPITLGHD